MGNMVQAAVNIRGTRPLLLNPFGPEAFSSRRREEAGTPGNDPTEWRRSLAELVDGKPTVKKDCVFSCLRDGAKNYGRGYQNKITCTLEVLDRVVVIGTRVPDNLSAMINAYDEPMYIDVRCVRNKKTKAGNIRYRVALPPGWTMTFTIRWDMTVIGRQSVNSIIRDSGRLVGIGDGRAIGFGRFEVETIEMKEENESAA